MKGVTPSGKSCKRTRTSRSSAQLVDLLGRDNQVTNKRLHLLMTIFPSPQNRRWMHRSHNKGRQVGGNSCAAPAQDAEFFPEQRLSRRGSHADDDLGMPLLRFRHPAMVYTPGSPSSAASCGF